MNLRQIEIFRAIMQHGSISAAARALNVSQPNISRVLHHTEDQQRMQLFQRLQGRLQPTPEALILYREVEKAYHGVEIVQDLARDLAAGRVGRLRIVCSPSPGMALVPAVMAKFGALQPRVGQALEILPQADLVDALLTHQADLGVSMFPSANPDLVAETLGTGEMRCVFPRLHALAALGEVTPADLEPHRLISYDRDTPQGQAVEDAFTRAGIKREVAIKVRFGHSACALAQAGAGVAVVDEFSLIGGSFPGLADRPFRPATHFTLSLLRNRHRAAARTADEFEQLLYSETKSLRP